MKAEKGENTIDFWSVLVKSMPGFSDPVHSPLLSTLR